MKPHCSQIIAVLLLLHALLFSACSQKEPNFPKPAAGAGATRPTFLNLDPKVNYVGDKECEPCHSRTFKSFKQTGMGRSFHTPSEAKRIEDLVQNNHVFDKKSNLHYEVIAKGKDLFQVEYRLDSKGHRVHELARKIDFIVGSGNHARTYLTEENGFLFEMPLTWYTQKKSWGMSPGFEVANYRFSRPINANCMTCHNSFAQYVPYSGNRFTNVPHGIGCERCHGPGALHVAKRYAIGRTGSARKEIDSTIVNPRRLSASLQMDVCYQCHLQGVVAIFKPGMQKSDFRPGMRLQDILSIFVLDNLLPGDLRVASHGERLTMSACFSKSNGKLVCISCHNPHQPVSTVPRASFNQACVGCHALAALSQGKPGARHDANADCVACHMPQGKALDVTHANFTDHWIQKRPVVQLQAQSNNTTLKNFFGEQGAGADLRLGLAYLQLYNDVSGDHPTSDHALDVVRTGLQNDPNNEEALYRLGLAYSLSGRLTEAAEQFRALTAIAPQNALAHSQLARVLNALGQSDEAVKSYQTALQLVPENAEALTQLGLLELKMNKTTEALDCLQKAAAVQPSYAAAHNSLGEFFVYTKRDPAAARKHFLDALHVDPDYAPSLANMGTLEMTRANYEEAARYLLRVIALNPKFVPAYGNLALLYSAQGQTAEARSFLALALKIDPNNARIKDLMTKMSASEQSGTKHKHAP